MIVDAGTFEMLRNAFDGDGGDAGGGGGGDPAPAADPAPAPTEGGADFDEPQVIPDVVQDDGEPDGADPTEKGAADPAPSAYVPNLKYKVDGAEKDFEEWMKPLIQDAETEEKFRDLQSRAHGIEAVKESRQQVVNEYGKLYNAHSAQTAEIQKHIGNVQKGDFQSFFEGLNIPEDAVLRYALQRIQHRNLPQDQQDAINEQRATALRLAASEATNAELMAGVHQTAADTRGQELDIALARPEVAAAMTSFNQRAGSPSAFKDEVVKRGLYYWNVHKKDITVDQAVREVLVLVGGAGSPAAPVVGSSSAAPQGTAAGGPPALKAPDKKPVIPNLKGTGQSPARQVPKSISDLRKLGQAAAASGN